MVVLNPFRQYLMGGFFPYILNSVFTITLISWCYITLQMKKRLERPFRIVPMGIEVYIPLKHWPVDALLQGTPGLLL
jgi:hypothetical protein